MDSFVSDLMPLIKTLVMILALVSAWSLAQSLMKG